MEVKLEKEDWVQARHVAITALKTILAQKVIYEMQLELAEKELSKYPKEKTK